MQFLLIAALANSDVCSHSVSLHERCGMRTSCVSSSSRETFCVYSTPCGVEMNLFNSIIKNIAFVKSWLCIAFGCSVYITANITVFA